MRYSDRAYYAYMKGLAIRMVLGLGDRAGGGERGGVGGGDELKLRYGWLER